MRKTYIFFFIIFLSSFLLTNLHAQYSDWSPPLNISNTSNKHSNSPSNAINKEGQLFVIWCEWDQPLSDLFARIYLTTHINTQWSVPLPITTELGKADWTPDIAVDTSGNPHVVWGEWFTGDVFYKYYDGSSWSNPVSVSESQGGAFYPCIAIGNDNTIHIAWNENYKVYYRKLKENQWSDKIVLSDTTMSAGSVKLCTDSNNSVHFTWGSYGPNEDDWRIWYKKLENGTFKESQIVYYDSTHHQSWYPDIAVFNNNLPAIVWEQVTQWDTIPITEKIFYSEFKGVEWTEAEAVSDSSRSSCPSISIDNNNIPCVVWSYTKTIPGEDHTYLLFSYKLNNNWIVPEKPDNKLPFNSGSSMLCIDKLNTIHLVWLYVQPSPQPRGEIYYSHHDKISAIKDDYKNLTDDIIFYPNFPNPFNQNTVIKYFLPEETRVYLAIYNALGEEIKVLINGNISSGEYEMVFNAKGLPSGIYFCFIRTERKTIALKMMLMK